MTAPPSPRHSRSRSPSPTPSDSSTASASTPLVLETHAHEPNPIPMPDIDIVVLPASPADDSFSTLSTLPLPKPASYPSLTSPLDNPSLPYTYTTSDPSLPSLPYLNPTTPYPPLPLPKPDSHPSLSNEELEEQNFTLINFKALKDWRTYVRRSQIPTYLIIAFLIGTSVPVAIEHKPLVYWAQPGIERLKHAPGGWLIPVLILIVISFPPLFGHEIIAVIVGLVWGFGLGFGIVALGSVLGEIGNFYAFRYLLSERGHRAERTNIRYACLARCIREGGFLIAVVARLSAIPGHLTTAVFSTCGMNFLVFTAAAILSMPKQMVTVYLGVILLNSASDRPESPRTKALSACVVILTVLVTIFAALWIYYKMRLVLPKVLEERRLRRENERSATALVPILPRSAPAPDISQSTVDLDLESATSTTITSTDTSTSLEPKSLFPVSLSHSTHRPPFERMTSDVTVGSVGTVLK